MGTTSHPQQWLNLKPKSECWWRCGATGTLAHCWWQYTGSTTLIKNSAMSTKAEQHIQSQ